MFDAVLQRSTRPRNRLGTGAILAALLHAAGLTALLGVSTRPEVKEQGKDVSIKFMVPLPTPPPPPPPPPASKKAADVRGRKVVRKPNTVVQPREIPKEKPPEAKPEKAPDVGVEGGVEGGVLGGVIGGIPGGIAGGTPGAALAGEPPKRIEIDESETKLQKIYGPPPRYTEKAIEKGVEGTMVLKCVVTAEGAVSNCRVLKSLPYMDSVAIAALEKWRFKPYTVDGKPIEVNYTFRLKLSLGW